MAVVILNLDLGITSLFEIHQAVQFRDILLDTTPRITTMDPCHVAQCACGPTYPYDPTVRTVFTDIDARIYAWLSAGGVKILSPAEAIDFEFLALNPLDPPLTRLDDQSKKDHFCQKLLLLGAKWWDSEARFSIVSAVEALATGTAAGDGKRVEGAFDVDKEEAPTMRERRLIRIGWASSGNGVLVSEFDTTWVGVEDEEWDRLRLCRTMEERCDMLRERFGAVFYRDLKKEYHGFGFFNAWQEDKTGQVGPLLRSEETKELWLKGYYRFS